MKRIILKGNICHTPEMGKLKTFPRSYVVAENGICQGIFHELPEQYQEEPITDYGDHLIIPGMTDLHIHAPQFAFHGTGMDYELLDWLRQKAFPEEMKYADTDYAARAYHIFVNHMKKSATARAVIFGTIHWRSTLILVDLLERSGLISYVGKVNMDRNAPSELTEKSAEASITDTTRFVEAALDKGYSRTKPILTPRFIPSCSNALLEQLSELQRSYDLPVQSHLSENPVEIKLVKELMPDADFYGDAYDRFGLFGRAAKTVMAHCIYSTEDEVQRMLKNGVFVAHCPTSNLNLSSGIAPIRKYIELGLRVGLGSDVAAGQTESIFRAITNAIQSSKMYWRYIDETTAPLSFAESFYLATKGGGEFFGTVGSFEEGYDFDALVLNDSVIPYPEQFTLAEKLERAVYLGLDQTGIVAKFVGGKKLW